MSMDVDISRVANTLRVPGLRYRSFGNQPVRPAAAGSANAPVIFPGLDAPTGSASAAPRPPEGASATMTLLADALSNKAPPARPPAAPGAPDWPLLDALGAPPAPPAPRGEATLVRLFGGQAAPVPPSPMPPSPVAAQPVPVQAPGPAAPLPAAARPGGTWAVPVAAQSPGPAASPATPGLLPADQVTTPLADIFQSLAQGGAAPASPFAALRLPGGAPGFR